MASWQCIPDLAVCHWPNAVKFCCSGMCHVISPATSGFCTPSSNRDDTSASATSLSSAIDNNNGSVDGQGASILTILGLIFLGLLLLTAPIALYLLYKKWSNRKTKKNNLEEFGALTRNEIKRFLEGNPEMLQINKEAHEMVDDMPYDRRYEIPEKSFTIDEKDILGSGAFGLVIKGKLWKQEVAIKTIKPHSEKTYMKALLTELKVLIHIGEHENVVGLLGAFTSNLKSGKLYLFLEFCALGNLLNYLRKHRKDFSDSVFQPAQKEYENVQVDEQPLTKKDLIKWSTQIANGLRFLSDKKTIHGDIAARNILLVSKDQCKITDFGLSKRLYEYTNYVKKQQDVPIPWKWMSIESLRDLNFSTESDVWSFGILLFEIFSLGEVPYSGLTWTQNFVYKLIDGYRLLKPAIAEQELYDIMNQCWSNEPKDRPTFQMLYATLAGMNEKY